MIIRYSSHHALISLITNMYCTLYSIHMHSVLCNSHGEIWCSTSLILRYCWSTNDKSNLIGIMQKYSTVYCTLYILRSTQIVQCTIHFLCITCCRTSQKPVIREPKLYVNNNFCLLPKPVYVNIMIKCNAACQQSPSPAVWNPACQEFNKFLVGDNPWLSQKKAR